MPTNKKSRTLELLRVLNKFAPEQLSNGQIKIHCPFTEKHTSDSQSRKQMFLSPSINRYHCFSCKSKGLLTRLLTYKVEVPYFDAIEMVHLVDYVSEAKKAKEEFELDDYWYIEPPIEFLDREYTEDTLRHFRVGRNAKGAIVIPCFDEEDTLKGLVYRVDTSSGKKVWHAQGFEKETYLYNYSSSYKEAHLVEGPTDLWRLWQFGYHNTIALLGSECSEQQVEMMKKIPKWYFSLDTDLPGVRAMHKIYHLLKFDVEIEFVDYGAKDPGELRRKSNYEKALKEAHSYAEFKLLTQEFLDD